MKTCAKCGEDKPATPEYFVRNGKVLHSYCRPCYRAYRTQWREDNLDRARKAEREWRARNPDKIKAKSEARATARLGMPPEAYDNMLEAQYGECCICTLPAEDNGKRLAIDHDHASGQVRGLLCSECNLALGLFKDDPGIVLAAAVYLMSFKRQVIEAH